MKFIIVTGGTGFIGHKLIQFLLKKTKYNIISLDNYSSGSKKNEIKNKRIKYINDNTINFSKIFSKFKKKIVTVFHFGEFSRIAQSFKDLQNCMNTNVYGSRSVIEFCLHNKIKIVYSATSASLGNNGMDANLSPYAFSKSQNVNLIMNYNEWFGLKYEIIYFYNVYGPGQIKEGNMAALMGIFETAYQNNEPLPIVSSGIQKRNFTHIDDTINIIFKAWIENKNRHFSIVSKQSYKILSIAKMFGKNFKFVASRPGERFASNISKKIRNKKIYIYYGKIDLKNYINKIKQQKI